MGCSVQVPLALSVPALALLPLLTRGVGTIASCRDRHRQPFAADSPWNMAIGDRAEYAPGNIFAPPKAAPIAFFNDHDYIITTTECDPLTAVYDQGEWGATPAEYCTRQPTAQLVTHIPFPANATFTAFGNNNAFAVLLPDQVTIVQSQPLYRCEPNSPVLALRQYLISRHTSVPINVSIEAGGYKTMLGPHGGTGLSAIGGTIRLGELAPGGSIDHVLKLELAAREYYHRFNSTACHRWPALPYDHCPEYGGTNMHIQPGSLLAVPPAISDKLETQLTSLPALKLLRALTDFGGYIVDDSSANRGTFVAEPAVVDEVYQHYGFPLNYVWAPNNRTKTQCNITKTACDVDCCAAPPCFCNRTAHDEFYTDMLAVFQALHVVTNSGPDTIGGGGKRRRPPAAPLCPLKTGDIIARGNM